MRKNIYTSPILTATACTVVGVLAALGKFNSILNFPVIFAFVVLCLGGLSLWREQPRRAIAARGLILLAGVAVAVGGWVYQGRQIDERLADRRLRVLDAIQGSAVPRLTGLEPLNTDRATWDAAASFTARATVVTFWARWCSPCWKEMEELEELYRRHKDSLYRYLLRRSRNRDIAEDVFQEVWGNIVKARHRYRPTAKFSTYLYRVAHNCFIDYLRKNKRHAVNSVVDPDCRPAPGDEPDLILDKWVARQRLEAAIVTLPDEQRDAFLLHEEAGLNIDMIARVTGANRETVKSRLRYANKKLKAALAESTTQTQRIT